MSRIGWWTLPQHKSFTNNLPIYSFNFQNLTLPVPLYTIEQTKIYIRFNSLLYRNKNFSPRSYFFFLGFSIENIIEEIISYALNLYFQFGKWCTPSSLRSLSLRTFFIQGNILYKTVEGDNQSVSKRRREQIGESGVSTPTPYSPRQMDFIKMETVYTVLLDSLSKIIFRLILKGSDLLRVL